jgi:hypothetical protein
MASGTTEIIRNKDNQQLYVHSKSVSDICQEETEVAARTAKSVVTCAAYASNNNPMAQKSAQTNKLKSK